MNWKSKQHAVPRVYSQPHARDNPLSPPFPALTAESTNSKAPFVIPAVPRGKLDGPLELAGVVLFARPTIFERSNRTVFVRGAVRATRLTFSVDRILMIWFVWKSALINTATVSTMREGFLVGFQIANC